VPQNSQETYGLQPLRDDLRIFNTSLGGFTGCGKTQSANVPFASLSLHSGLVYDRGMRRLIPIEALAD
jgi:hypothetical protein